MLESIGVAFATVFFAEMGDKSQLLALSLSARYRTPVLLAAVTTASALTIGVSVAVGSVVGELIPTRALQTGAGALFLVFAVVTLLGSEDDEGGAGPAKGGFVAAVFAISAAELGDKTMLAALALSATSSSLGVWVGGTVGMALAGAIGVLVGSAIWKRLNPRAVRLVSAALFAVVGGVLLVDAWLG